VVGKNDNLFGISPNKDGVWKWEREENRWAKVGGPAHQLAMSKGTLYGISPNGHECWVYSGHGDNWSKSSDHITQLIGGGNHMYGLDHQGDVFVHKEGHWHKIGGPGHKFVATKDHLVGISPNKDSCWAHVNGEWKKVGGPIDDLIAGSGKIYGISPGTHDLYHFEFPEKWSKVGGPGKQFVSTKSGLYGISPDGNGVWAYNGSNWQQVGSGVEQLIPGKKHLFVVLHNHDIARHKYE